jgi:hypothetical protein
LNPSHAIKHFSSDTRPPSPHSKPPPTNDNICNATEVILTKNTIVPWNNVDATAEMGEPSPGPGTDVDFGGCESQDGWCNFTDINEPGVQSSIWYKFTATSSCVTISMSDYIFDMQLALWGLVVATYALDLLISPTWLRLLETTTAEFT